MMKEHIFFGRTARAACGANGASGGYLDLHKAGNFGFEDWLALPAERKCAKCAKSYVVRAEAAKLEKAK